MANSTRCSVCEALRADGETYDPTKSNRKYSKLLGVSETSVRRHRKHVDQGVTEKLGEDREVSMQSQIPDSTPRTEVTETSSNGARSVQNFQAIRHRPVTLEDARQWLEASGDSPDDYHLAVKSIAYGNGLFSNKMSAWPKPKPKAAALEKGWELYDEIGELKFDPVALLTEIRQGPVEEALKDPNGGEGAFVLSLNDTQLGKDEGGGTPATLARVEDFSKRALERIYELRSIGRTLNTLVLIGGGDIVEGCVIYPNQSYAIDLDRRGQINAAVSMILSVIDRLAPAFEEVIVLAARGNHGENRINGNRTTLYDNDDTMVFEMAKMATDRDPSLAHVEYIIAESEAGVYVDVAGWRLATTHGDVYGKGVSGATKEKKAHAWYKNMAGGRDPLGLADILVTHHYHHNQMADWGACLWRQTPALDGGSEYYRQSTGEHSEPGMLTFVITPDVRYGDELVIS